MVAATIGSGVLAVVGSACSKSSESPPTIQESVSLEAFSSCEALEAHIEDTAVQLMRSQMRGNYAFGGVRGGVEESGDLAAPTAAANGAGATSGPTNYTSTNVQVKGVDEADFMKNTGTHIYTLAGNRLYIAKSWPASELAVISRLDLEGYPTSMYLDDERDRLVVLASVNAPYATVPSDASNSSCLADGYCGWAVATKVSIIDVADPAAPRVLEALYLPGWLVNSRRVGGSVRLVLGDTFRWPDNLRWYPEWEPGIWNNEFLLQSLLDSMADQNEAIIRARSLSDWLPSGLRRLEDGATIEVEYDCADFHRVTASVDLGFTTVATVNLDDLSTTDQTSVIASTSEVYASPTSLYLATRHWWWWPMPGQEDHTYLFKFDITQPQHADFVAAGGVPGHIVNQFSLDEHEGHLRVATTIATRVEVDDNEWGRIETTNRISVLGTSDGELSVVGRTEDIAGGERIMSARFLGDRGFVVTFRQIDPLFTVDLSSPDAPKIVGELKVPGFSSYIHPLDEDHLLTIGVHIDEPSSDGRNVWSTQSMKLSIFDVSDFAHPAEAFTARVGTAYGHSEAQWEHKAFNFFPERGLLAVPFTDWGTPSNGDPWGNFVSDLRVFKVDVETGIAPLGAISMAELYQRYDYGQWSWSWSPWVRRSVMADNFAYAVSDAGIRVASTTDLSRPIATALFEPSRSIPAGR